MQRNEVEAIFQERKEKLLQGITPSTNPIYYYGRTASLW